MNGKKKITKSQKKKIVKTATAVAKNNPVLFVVLAVIILIVAVVGYFVYTKMIAKNVSSFSLEEVPAVEGGELAVHTLELGNNNPGDCTYIKANGYDILIDAGSKESSISTIIPYLKNQVTDGILEFVILTHADTDHIVCLGADGGIFDEFTCQKVIDSPITNKATDANYVAYGNKLANEGAVHYTALECYNNENGAQRIYDLGSGVKMEFLYNYYYEHSTTNENDYSVCVQFSHGARKFLFTGDLEIEGEEKLVENNPSLSPVILFKAGHHGSSTSSNDVLLSVIRPTVCVVNCVAGGQYGFPTQAFIGRIFTYTNLVFVTREKGGKLLNGNIVVISSVSGVTVSCSNNDTLFKDTDWFKANRTL